MSSESQPPQSAATAVTSRKTAVRDTAAGKGAAVPSGGGGVVIDRRARACWRAAASAGIGVPRDPYFAIDLDTLNS